jgi:hypothetical protein
VYIGHRRIKKMRGNEVLKKEEPKNNKAQTKFEGLSTQADM